MQNWKEFYAEITYQKQAKSWFVLSGYKGDNILYDKIYWGKKQTNSLRFEYPKTNRKRYDEIVLSTLRSFKHGPLNKWTLY
jgi:hypothetical protein